MRLLRVLVAVHVTLFALSALLLTPRPAAAQDAEGAAWLRVTDCAALANFRSRFPNSRYAGQFSRIRQANGQPCPPRPTPPRQPRVDTPPPPTITCDDRWTTASRRNTATALEDFAERCPRHPQWREALRRARALRNPPPPPPRVLTGYELEGRANAERASNRFDAARELYRQACYASAPSASACNSYAFELERNVSELQQPGSTQEDRRRADVIFATAHVNWARGCTLQTDPLRCNNAWLTGIQRPRAEVPAAQVLDYHRRSGRGANVDCTSWRAQWCDALARLYDDRNAMADRPMTKALYVTACRNNYAPACPAAALAHALDYQPVGAAIFYDFGAVRYFFDRAPAASRVPGPAGIDCSRLPFPCFAIAYGLAYPLRYQNEPLPTANLPLAQSFATASCAAGDHRGCNLKGRLIWDARTYYQAQTAFGHFGTACRVGRVPDACNNLGLAYEQGFGVRANPIFAVQNFQTACQTMSADWPGGPYNGTANGCYNLGRAYRDGIYYARNPTAANSNFVRACDLGHRQACQAVGRQPPVSQVLGGSTASN